MENRQLICHRQTALYFVGEINQKFFKTAVPSIIFAGLARETK